VLVGAFLALLPLFAVMQYRWLGEVSNGERERMKNNLQVSAEQFCREFDRELTQAYLNFQPAVFPFANSPNSEEQRMNDLASHYRYWMDHAAHPKLLREIYQIDQAPDQDGGEGALSRFNPAANRFEPSEWPGQLAGLRERMNSQRANHAAAQSTLREVLKLKSRVLEESAGQDRRVIIRQSVRPAVIHLSMGPVDDGIPALVIPAKFGPLDDLPAPHEIPLPQSYRVITLDLDYIKREFIPELTRRHFSDVAGGSDFNFAIKRRSGAQDYVYASDGAAAFATGDATGSFFNVRINEGDRMLFARFRGVDDLQKAPGISENRRVAGVIIQSDVRIGQAETQQGKTLESIRNGLNGRDEGRWQLIVKHRAGSLEAAVATAHRRNLLVSFGVLLLLGVSVGLIVLSSRRAQALAERQMEFVAGVSHELRTPLAVICSAAENLADGVIDNRDHIRRYGGLIRDEGRRLTGMVEQVLEFAGAQSGKQTFDLKPTDLTAVIDNAVAACHLQMVEGGFELEKNIAAGLPPVNADGPSLSRAIQNLLSNAMKYSGDSRWIGLRVEKAGDAIQIKISDHGVGISSDETDRIFEPFYRGRDVTDAQIHGNGLGLSLVKHIIEGHRGQVTVESEPREKTVFTLHLPIERSRSQKEKSFFQGA